VKGYGDMYRSSKENLSSERESYFKTGIEFLKVILIALVCAVTVILFILEVVIVDGRSMEPTLKNDDRIVIEKLSFYIKKPTYDDIIVFRYPINPAKKFIKRVIALEGDRIKIQNDKIFLNGKVKYESYVFEKKMADFSEVVIPKDTVFVLGDNRSNSKDSRSRDVGFVSLDLITGKAIYKIYPIKMIGRVE
jgi:signal peptidase I